MSYHNQVTFNCDSCDTNFTIDEETMELPSGWIGIQVIVADTEGCIPEHEREVYSHLCSRECLIEFISGDEMRQRLCLVDKPKPLIDLDEDEEDTL